MLQTPEPHEKPRTRHMGALRDLLPCVLDESPLCKNFCSERFQVCEGILLPDCQRSQHLGTKSPSSPNGCHQQAAHTGSEVSTNRPAATRAILESHNSSPHYTWKMTAANLIQHELLPNSDWQIWPNLISKSFAPMQTGRPSLPSGRQAGKSLESRKSSGSWL